MAPHPPDATSMIRVPLFEDSDAASLAIAIRANRGRSPRFGSNVVIADAPLNVLPIYAHAGMPDGKDKGKIRGRDGSTPEANARIVKLTYDTGVMKGSLDDGNASVTPGYPQKPLCHPFHPAANAHTKPGVTFGGYSCAEKSHLATYI